MKIFSNADSVTVSGLEDFDLEKIFTCGQCFRWQLGHDGYWRGAALGHALKLVQLDGGAKFFCSKDEFDGVWYDYFDLQRDYADIRKRVSIDGYMHAACEYGRGIRILNQDRWEALCSFIFSQCNNIPRISGIIERLCALAGDELWLEGQKLYSFPSPQRVASMSLEDLAPLRSGYRAPYVLAAARSVSEGKLDLEALGGADASAAMTALTALEGVGPKVASCAMLFSLRVPEAFPIDTWIKQAIEKHYPQGFDPKIFGRYAGVAQQYMFYYIRSGADK